MPEDISGLLQTLAGSSELQATLLVALVALVGLLYLLRLRLRRWRCERKVGKIIHRLGTRRIENISLPDGTGGEVTIDHLLLSADAILIVGVMRFDGLIFGGRLTEQWTQVLGRRSYKFENPNQYLQRQINAIKQLVPDAPVNGRHVFPHARFPKDKPDNVILLADLKTLPRRARYRDVPESLRAAWQQLEAALA